MVARMAEWATPHVQRWRRKRLEDRVEGERHLASGNFSEAEKHLRAALAVTEQRGSAKDKTTLRLELAEALRGQQKFDEAGQIVRVAIEAAGKDAGLRGKALEALADLQIARGDWADAEKSLQEATELSQKLESLARRTHKTATVINRLGRGKEALETYERAEELYEEAYGSSTEQMAALLGETGAVHREQGNHAQAQEYLQRALEIQQVCSAADSREAAENLAQLAASLEESGDLDGAMAQYERALKLKERQIGGSMEDLAEMQARAARMYMNWGEKGKARQLLAQALPQLARKPGPSLIAALETMALLEESSGRREEAQEYRERAQIVAADLAVTG